MQDYRIYEFDELIPDKSILKKAALILGNGASIAVNDCFFYTTLFDIACSNSILDTTSRELFDKFQTTDFEFILNRLRQASIINNVLNLDNDNIASQSYDNIRNSLIGAVKATHIKRSDVVFQIDNMRIFMEQFKTVVSLNYDLLVYWAIMASNNATSYKMKDCFTKTVSMGFLGFDYDIEKLREEYHGVSDPTLVFYPHGSLILVSDDNNEELKIKVSSQNNLFDEISKKWDKKFVPLFVSEGSSEQKLKAIRRSAYLNFVYENVLGNLDKLVIIYGWKLAEQEEHLIDKIFNEKQGHQKVMISIYLKDPSYRDRLRDEQVRIVNLLKRKNPQILVSFFDSSSSNCWSNY